MNSYHKIFTGITLGLSVFCSTTAVADLVVIVNPANHNQLTEADVRNIFLGKTRSYPDGTTAIPVELGNNTPAKNEFNKDILKKDDAQVRAYWARMVFTGRATPPKALGSDEEVINLIASNPNLMGYVSSEHLSKTVRVAYKP